MLAESPAVQARLGLIIPSSNRLTESHMRRFAPVGLEVHVTRLRMTGPHHVPLDALVARAVDAAHLLADAGCDAIVFHCTASSMEAGRDGEARLLHALRSATDCTVSSTASAVVAALRAVQAQKIVLLSPYVAATHEHEIGFLAECGIATVGGRALGLRGGADYMQVTPREWLRHAVEACAGAPKFDAVFLSCTNIHSLEVIEPLEACIERPVLASNQAVLWHALRTTGLPDVVPGFGRLCGTQGRLSV